MDTAQVFFSLQPADVLFDDSTSFCVPAPEIDLGKTVFLTAEKSSAVSAGLFFSLRSSLKNAMFHVREGFEKVVISVVSEIRRFFCRKRSMWRERAAAVKFSGLIRHSAVLVMRT